MTNAGFIVVAGALILTGLLMINGYYNDPMRAYEYEESGKCYRGYGEWSPDEVDCTSRTLERVIFFGIVLGLIAGGIVALIKGLNGIEASRQGLRT